MPVSINIEGTKGLTNAIVDLFSPLTELAGTIGDQIRVYRETSIIRSFEKARLLAEQNNLKIQPPPLKFLVPYMEDCSLEDSEDNSLMDMWAHLLASAANEYKSEHNLFRRFLKELTSTEASLLEHLIDISYHKNYKDYWNLEDSENAWENSFVFIAIRDIIDGSGGELNEHFDFDKLEKEFREKCEEPGSIVHHFSIARGKKGEYPFESILDGARQPIADFNIISISMVKSLGLVGEFKSTDLWFGDYEFDVRSYYLTNLGCKFLKVCTSSKTSGEPIISQEYENS